MDISPFRHILPVIAGLAAVISFSCSSDSDSPNDDPVTPSGPTEKFVDYSSYTVKTLDDRAPKVYWGMDNRWHDITSSSNRDKWKYTREHLTGFYTNFIDMWCMVYQNSRSAEETMKNLYDTFTGKSAFFEATMETRVNDSPEGYNNEETDRRTIDFLTGAGFSVDYTSVNYMSVAAADYCKERMKLVATYKGDRKCFYLCGPWCFNGDINNDADAKEMSLWGDGIQTDGPLGYWYINQNKMRECSYSIVKRMKSYDKETAIMLAPYSVEVAGYQAPRDFLSVSKDCVFGHEDNNAMPELWTLWMYGSGGLGLFPEENLGQPQCTATGVAYWLLKHLNEFPTYRAGNVSSPSTSVDVEVAKGKTVTIPLTFGNGNCTGVELAPVIRAIFNTKAPGWKYKFKYGDSDVTPDIVFNGGLNCVKKLRISSTSPLSISLVVMAEQNASDLKIDFQAMSNVSNTANKKDLFSLNLKVK